MSEEISFVEVLMISYEPGDKEYQDWLENEVHCFDTGWVEATEEIEEVIKAKEQKEKNQKEAEEKGIHSFMFPMMAYEPDTLIIEPLTTFIFSYFGQSLDRNYSSGLEWESLQMDAAYVFEPWLNDLKEMGQKILADKKQMGHPKANKVARFVILWSYNSWQDSYNKEWDSEWELLGLVEPKEVAKLLGAKLKQDKLNIKDFFQ